MNRSLINKLVFIYSVYFLPLFRKCEEEGPEAQEHLEEILNTAKREVFEDKDFLCRVLEIEIEDLLLLLESLDEDTFWPVLCGIVYEVADTLLDEDEENEYFVSDSESYPYTIAVTLLVRVMRQEGKHYSSVEYINEDPEPLGNALEKVSVFDPSWEWYG